MKYKNLSIRNLHRLVAKHAHFAVLISEFLKELIKKDTPANTLMFTHLYYEKELEGVVKSTSCCVFFDSSVTGRHRTSQDSHKWAAVAVFPVTAGNVIDVNVLSFCFHFFHPPYNECFLSKHDPRHWFCAALLEILAVRMQKALASQFSQQIILI